MNSRFRRRGTMYVAVVGCALVVSVIGTSAILAARIEGKIMSGSADLGGARHLAQGAIDIGLFTLYNEATWRSTRTPGAWSTNQAAGDGTFSLSVADPVDGVLSDAKWEPLTFTGTGRLRDARYMLETTSIARPSALPVLNTCLHSGGNVTVNLLRNITVSGAPLSMNGSVSGPGTVTGNVAAGSVGVLPIVIGTSTIPSPAKEMTDAGLFSLYKGLATTISGVTDIDRCVLSNTSNPWGTANADGVYYIDAGSVDLRIRRSRVQGTLLVKCSSGAKVVLDDKAFVHGFRADYPTLLIDGSLEIALSSGQISEGSEGVNLNPSHTPYLGASDSDTSDSYPNELRGLVHVTGNVTFSGSSTVRGVIIANGNVTVSASPQLIHEPTLYTRPPMGYVTYSMQLASGSWRRVITP